MGPRLCPFFFSNCTYGPWWSVQSHGLHIIHVLKIPDYTSPAWTSILDRSHVELAAHWAFPWHPTSPSDSVCPKVNHRLVHPRPTLLLLQSSPSERITTASCYLLRSKPYPLSATPAAVPQHLLLLANTRSPTTSHHLTAAALLRAATLSCLNYRSGLPVVFPPSPTIHRPLSLSPVIRWSFQHVKSDHFTPLCKIIHGCLWCSKEKPVSMRWPIRPWTILPPVASLGQFVVTPKASTPYRAFACTAGPCL